MCSDGVAVSALRKAEQFVVGVIGIVLVYQLVRPGNQTAKIIEAQGRGFRMMVDVAMGERHVEERNVPRFEALLGDMNDETMTELFAGLSDVDLDWVEEMLRGV